jgi:hypothetical protein
MRKNSTNIHSQFIKKENGIHYMKACKGCKTYENEMDSLSYDQKRKYIYLCNISVPFRGEETCPCSICIVKMVCNRNCKALSDYLYNFPRFKGHKK